MSNPTWLYVAAVYALGLLLVRRTRADLPWRHAIGFYLLVLLFLWRPMTQEYVSFPTDVIRIIPPWSNVLPPRRPPITKYEVSNMNTHDATMQLIPWAHQVRESWRSGRVPLWNSRAGCGYPLLANGQSSALSPIRWIALPLPLGYAMTAEAALKLLMALTGMYLFCRRRYGDAASVAGAVAFGFCTYLTAWLHFAHITTAVMLPAVLLAIDLLAERFSRGRFAFAAVVFAITAVAGHPETAIHIAFVAVPFALWVILVERGSLLHGAGSIAAAGIVAILLAAPFLFPFIEALHRSQRYQELQVTPNRETPYSDFLSAALLVQPGITGHLPEERPWGPTTVESISGFAGVFGLIGAVAVALHIAVRRRWRDRELLYLVLAFIALAAVLNWHFISGPLHEVLGMVAHARLRFVLCAMLALLAAAAVDMRSREPGIFILAGAAAVSAWTLYLMHAIPFPGPGARDTALLSLMPSLVVILCAIVMAKPGRMMHIGTAAVIVMTLVELFLVNAGWNPSMPLRTSYPETPLVKALDQLRAEHSSTTPFRIGGLGSALYPNTNVMFGFEDARVHDPMANGRYLGFLRELTSYDPADYYAKWNDPDSPLLDLLNVAYFVTDRGVDLQNRARFELVYDGFDGRIYRNRRVMPRFFSVPNVIVEPALDRYVPRLEEVTNWRDTAVTQADAPTRAMALVDIESARSDRYQLRIRSTQPALIVSSIALYPGWRIRTGRRSLEPIGVNGPFLGFVVPPGDRVVTIRYAPSSFRLGVAAFVAGLLCVLCVFVGNRPRMSARVLHDRQP